MGTIRNKMVIVHHYDLGIITKIREDAVLAFQQLVSEDYAKSKYDVNLSMISPILSSMINGEYSFVIMGDCSKLGWETAEVFERGRLEWVNKWRSNDDSYKILIADFGEDYGCSIEE